MEYRRSHNSIVVSLLPGDEIIAALLTVAAKEKISLGKVEGIGAVNAFKIGLFDVTRKQYYVKPYRGAYEIVSLLGNLSLKDGEPYVHCHLAAADADNSVVGGHLNEAVISGVGELIITVIEGSVEREFSPEIGLNVFRFLD